MENVQSNSNCKPERRLCLWKAADYAKFTTKRPGFIEIPG